MGVDTVEIGVCLRKSLIFTIRTCYRSACSHPFVVVVLFFFFLIYRFLPSLFGFLVSSSPVLVCTAVLLGTLLSFGHPNIPEIEEEDEEEEKTRTTHHEISSLKVGVAEDNLVIDNEESFSVETLVEKRRDIEEKVADESFSVKTHVGKRGDIDEKVADEKDLASLGTHDDGLIKVERELHNLEFLEKREFQKEKPLIEDVSVACDDDVGGQSSNGEKKEIEGLKVETEKPPSEYTFGSTHDSSSWKEIEDHDESSSSDSDGAESSSPDASMADIIPMLDELHPLLDDEDPQPALIPLDDSDVASDDGSGEEVENQEEEEDVEEQEEEKDDGTKAVVTWTEDDQKNLMDLGNSELERNRRLESLIARRRSRKNLRMMVAEKNLIDLEGNDPPFQIAPISTARRNPFDIHYDSNEAMGLPPIPGSAPSVLLPRRNPFDLPYDPFEERPDLSGGSFEEEFLTGHEKDMYFRRHESFSLGSSLFRELKPEKHDIKFRPYFVTERVASEGMGYPTIQRQSSEMSNSKASSNTETESLSFIVDQDNHMNLIEEEFAQEGESHVDHAPDYTKLESQSSEEGDLVEIDQEDKRVASLSRIESEGASEKDIHERESTFSETGSIALPIGLNTSDIYEKSVVADGKQTGSSSSSSEVSEKIFQVRTDEGFTNPELTRGNSAGDSNNSMQALVVDSYLRHGIGVDDSQTKKPIYDWSPSTVEKKLSGAMIIDEALHYVDKGVLSSIPSISSDMHVEVLEMGSTPVPIKRTISFTEGEKSSLNNESIEKEITSGNEGLWVDSSQLYAVEEIESSSKEVTMISELDVTEVGFSGYDHNVVDPTALTVPLLDEQFSFDSSSSSTETNSEDEGVAREEADLQFEHDQVPSSSFDTEIHMGAPQFDVEVDHKTSNYSDGFSSKDITYLVAEKSSPVLEKSLVQSPSYGDHEESQEPSILPAPGAYTKEAVVLNSSCALVVHEHEKDFSDLSPLVSVPSSTLSEVSENNPSTGCQESVEPQFAEEEFNEAEGVKEIDEGLLTELDVVGDFSVKELGTSTNQIVEQLVVGVQESLSGVHVLEAKSSKDIEDNSDKSILLEAVVEQQKPREAVVSSAGDEAGNGYTEVTGSTLELQFLEASSIEDIDSAFKELQEIDEKSSSLESIHDEPMSKETEVEHAEFELPNQDLSSKNLSLEPPFLEPRSLTDIDSAFKQLHEKEFGKAIALEPIHKESILEETKGGSADCKLPNEDSNSLEVNSGLPVLKARSLEDIGSAFKQLHEQEIGNSMVLEPINNESTLEETEGGATEDMLPILDPNPLDNNLELPVHEARSVEDIDSAFKQLHEREVGKSMVLESIHTESTFEETKCGIPEDKLPIHDPNPLDNNLELPVLEARSLEDIDSIDSVFKELNECEAEKPVVESIHNGSMLEEAVFGSAEFKLHNQDQNPVETNLELPDIKERSLEDIDSPSKQLDEGRAEKPVVLESIHRDSILEETEVGSAEFELYNQDQNEVEMNLELPDIKERSQDIDSSSKKLHEGETEKPVVLESIPIKSILEEAKVQSTDLFPADRNPNATNIDLELQEHESRSVDDINSAFKQLGEGGHDHEDPTLPESVV